MTTRFETVHRSTCALVLAICGIGSLHAGNPPPTQLFYVPVTEDQQLAAFSAINANAIDPISVFVTFSAATDGTVIYYDHWEDGYESDITAPRQPTTLVFGDGNPTNGYPPGNAGDLIPAGTVFNLRNFVNTTTLQQVVDYDARDKIASFKPISVTKTVFPSVANTLMAGCLEMLERGIWGTEYRSPVGVDMPTGAAAGNLTFDENLFSYASLVISAGPGGASVQIDKDNDGAFEETVVLGEGESVTRSEVNVGARVLADKPVQVVLFTGTVGSNYASRDTSLLPVDRWSSDYFNPVSTPAGDGTVTFLYNPGASAITVSYDYRTSATAYVTATVSVPAGGNARVVQAPANGTNHFGAYRFYTTGGGPPLFYAFSAIDADAVSGNNQAWDGGFTLVGRPSLTTQALVSLGIGRDPYSATNPTENGNPIWITTAGNGHSPTTVYVDYNGDNAGALTDPNGNQYDVAYSLRELQQQKIYDPDGDQSGMLVYTLNPSVRIAAVWGQDSTVAAASQPGLDVASLIPPLREGDAGKKSSIAVDADGDGHVSTGDTLEYDMRAVSSARTNIPGPFAFVDNLPAETFYVPGSTRYRYSVGGAWQAWTAIPDDGSGSPFPLDGSGYSIPGNLFSAQQLQVVFLAVVNPALASASFSNTGLVEISPYGLLLPVSWTDTVYGSIGDRVWSDLDGDGSQDPGETGIPNIVVWADLNNNGVQDSGEPSDTTNSQGEYLLSGLLAGNYTVRVDPVTIAAVNVGYGPSYDLDGLATTHAATVALAAAQKRADADFGYRVGASVGDRVWSDLDGDGVQENGEPGINGIRVYLDSDSDNTFDPGEPNTITSGNGSYQIGNLGSGTYTVRIDTATLPTGGNQTYDLNGGLDHEASVTLLAAEHRADLDFGYRGNLSIGDLVWEDNDANGIRLTYNVTDGRIDINNSGTVSNADDGTINSVQIIDGYVDINASGGIGNADDGVFQGIAVFDGGLDTNASGGVSNADDAASAIAGESGIANVRVYIDSNGNGAFDPVEPSAITSATGSYSIGNLFNSTITVRVDVTTLPASYVPTYDPVSPVDDDTALVVLSGASRTDLDFGYRNDASIGDLVWNDRNSNGARDAGEAGIEGVLVYVDGDNDNIFDQGVERFAITDVDGIYLIDNLPAGSYNVRVDISTLPQGCTQTHDLDGGLDHEAARTLVGTENAVDVDFGYRASAAFGDYVWNDADADTVQEPGEAGIGNVRVYTDINGNGVFDGASEPSALTNGTGAYTIGSLVPGTNTARVDSGTLPAGFVATYDAVLPLDSSATFFVSANQTRTDIDFGYTQPVTIGDRVWNDASANGQKDLSETGRPNVTVTLYNTANSTVAATTTTDASGLYSFTPMPGTYYVVFESLAGFVRTPADQGADGSDSDAHPATGRTPDVTLAGGQSDFTLDAGYYQPGSISGIVLLDTDNNNTGDSPIAGVQLTLKNSAGNEIDSDPNAAGVQPTTAITDIGGAYTFGNLPPATYRVAQSQPSGHLSVSDVDGANNNVIGDQTPIVITAGLAVSGRNFIEELPALVIGHLHMDYDGDGLQNGGEPDLADVDVLITDSALATQTVTTDSSGNWTVSVTPGITIANVQESDPQFPVGHIQTQGDDPTTVNALTGATTQGGTDGYFLPGSISGHVRLDSDNNDSGDSPFPGVVLNLLNGSGGPVLDGFGDPIQVATNATGSYVFTLVPPGTYRVSQNQPAGYGSVSDVDGANNNIIGDQTPIVVTPGLAVGGRDFVEIDLGSISGRVFKDSNNDGVGDTLFPGVILTLLDGSGNPVDADPIASGIQPSTSITSVFGSYRFDDLRPGNYQVSETQPAGYGSVSDVDGGNPDLIGNIMPVTVNPGQLVTERDFVEIALGSIRGFVRAGASPLAGVTLTLLDENGDPVDGDPNTPTIDFITTVTASDGSYTFSGVVPGDYQVSQTQPFGYLSVGDIDGGDPNIIGDGTLIAVGPGQENAGNNFIETLDICPDIWAEWKFQHPGETADGNPDADSHDNLSEFAFAMPAKSGTGSLWLGDAAWLIRPSATVQDTLEGVFVRPKGAWQNVTYTLEYVNSLASPLIWASVEIIPAMIDVVDNSDCTETVTILDLEAVTGMTGGEGIVRIRVDLDEENDSSIDHKSYTEVEGWKETALDLTCRTYSNPFLRSTRFTGTVTGVAGQTLDLTNSTGSADLATRVAGGACFIEVVAGDNEGHRFDVASATANTLTLAADSNLFEHAAPHNTLAGTVPANLAGDTIVLHRHWVLADAFPPTDFSATNDRTTADQVQLFAGGQWANYWLCDDGILPPHWVKSGDNTYADQGAAVLAPGQGIFINKRQGPASVLAYGEVRTNGFIRPLAPGSNLVSGGYPLDQSAAGRAMTIANGVFGSRDIATADSFFVWKGDASLTDTGYVTYFLNNNAPRVPPVIKWAKIGDASLLPRDAEILFLGNRSIFIRSKDGLPGYTVPSPWTP